VTAVTLINFDAENDTDIRFFDWLAVTISYKQLQSVTNSFNQLQSVTMKIIHLKRIASIYRSMHALKPAYSKHDPRYSETCSNLRHGKLLQGSSVSRLV
jgi:hypothetical protein